MRELLRWTCSHPWVCVLLFHLTSGLEVSQAQDWQALYNQALAKYQSEDFQNSISLAEEALQKSGTVTSTSRAYTIQLITTNCAALNDADTGLKYVDEEIKLFQQLEGEKSKSLAEALKKEIIFLQGKNMIKQALEKSSGALQSFTNSYGPDAIQTTQFNVLVGDLVLSNRDSVKAKQIWNKCLPSLAGNPEAKDDYNALLFNTAALEEKLKDKNAAGKKYSELVGLLEQAHETADPMYEESKKALARLGGKNAPTETTELQELLKKAVAFQSQNQNSKAAEVYRQCIDATNKTKTDERSLFSVYFNYARLLLDEGALGEAEPLLKQAKSLAATLFKPNDLEFLLVALADADLTFSLGQKQEATGKYNQLIGRLDKDSKIIPYLVNSCNQLLNSDAPAPAALLLRPIVCCPAQVTDRENFNKAALTYSNALLALNKPDSLLLFLNQPVFTQQLWGKFKKVEAMEQLGQWPQALDELNKMQTVPTASNREKGEVVFQLANLEHKMGDYLKAEEDYLKAQKYFEIVSERDSWQVGNSLATLYSRIGNFDKSEKILSDLLQKVPKQNPLHLALLANLSADYIDTNELEKARGIQEKIVSAEKELVGERHPDYAQSIVNFAVLYQKDGRYADARQLLEKALAISKSNFGELSVDYAQKESVFGAVLKDAGDYVNAQTSLAHAEKVLKESLGSSHPEYISCEYNLAMALQRTGNSEKALPLMEHLAGSYKKQILEFFPAMSEQEQVSLYNKVSKPIQDYQQFAITEGNKYPELIGHLFDFRLATKALLLNSSTKVRERVLNGKDTELKNQFLTWISLKDQIGKLYSTGQASAAPDRVAQLEARADELEKNLSVTSAAFKSEKMQRDVTWNKIQSVLHEGEAAMEFIRVKASGKTDSVTYAALVLRNGSTRPQLIVLPGGKKMEEREFSFYKNSIIHLLSNERSYNVYWRPLENSLKGVNKIYVSPDGIYNKLNLATLFDPAKKEFMGSRYQFFMVSSLRDLIYDQSTTTVSSKTAQFFGPIDFDGVKSETNHFLRTISSSRLPSLPGTKTEIEKIDHVLKTAQWSSVTRLQSEASEQTLKELTNTSVLHIATHGFFVVAGDEEKQVVIGGGDQDNPLFRSGLILPGSSTEDGFLTAYEVKNLNFEATDLVVLSACETGSGEVKNGEGVYGLQRAFLISGVKNILMSLWKVDDDATQELMVKFYQKLLTEKNKNDALRQAQIELMNKYTEPFFWGGFVLISKPN